MLSKQLYIFIVLINRQTKSQCMYFLDQQQNGLHFKIRTYTLVYILETKHQINHNTNVIYELYLLSLIFLHSIFHNLQTALFMNPQWHSLN